MIMQVSQEKEQRDLYLCVPKNASAKETKTSRDYLALLKIGAPKKKKGKELKLKYLMSYARPRAF
jgi:hypothetical protein